MPLRLGSHLATEFPVWPGGHLTPGHFASTPTAETKPAYLHLLARRLKRRLAGLGERRPCLGPEGIPVRPLTVR